MIAGIGTDIVSTPRIAAALERHGERFLWRVLSPQELHEVPDGLARTAWVARRWAAKEAVAKALGTGIGRQCRFQDIRIAHDALGAPSVVLSGAAAKTAGRGHWHLSISDEQEMAVAFVVWEKH